MWRGSRSTIRSGSGLTSCGIIVYPATYEVVCEFETRDVG